MGGGEPRPYNVEILTLFRIFVFSVLILSASCNAYCAPNVLKNVRYHSYPNKTRIVLDSKGPITYTIEKIGPKKIHIRLHNITPVNKFSKIKHFLFFPIYPRVTVNDRIVKKVKLKPAYHSIDAVFKLNARKTSYNIFYLKNPDRLVLDFIKVSNKRKIKVIAEWPKFDFKKIDLVKKLPEAGKMGPMASVNGVIYCGLGLTVVLFLILELL